MSLKSKNVLFLDLQTTGAKPGSANILEIAWSCCRSEGIESHLVQQPEEQAIPRRIQIITGISNDDMTQAKALTEILSSLKEYLELHFNEEVLAIIHFAQFEKPFLLDAFEKSQQLMPFSILCTHEIAKRLMPNLPTRGIKGLAGYFGFPSGELKRATNHVQATQVIWQGLTSALAEKSIYTLEELREWMQSTPKATRLKYEYPLPKEKRLSLPKQPGIYRMMSKWGEVLYVGKATSLHDRVNSYFRGQKNRDSRKLEMLTQVWDLQVTPVGSPLEAALLETDEIKRLDPPYNISLKTGQRNMAFFNHDFTSVTETFDDEHVIGPFSNPMVLDSVRRLSQSIQTNEFDENIFFNPIDALLLKKGFEIFCIRHGLEAGDFCTVRSVLAMGLNWARKLKDDIEADQEEPEEVDTPLETSNDENKEDVNLTPEDIADKFERHFVRAAKAYWRTKKLTKLLNANIYFETNGKTKSQDPLKIRQGQIIAPEAESSPSRPSWKNLSIDTYDRMTVLFTELEKLRKQKKTLLIERNSWPLS